jgi:general secretion pathway protein L
MFRMEQPRVGAKQMLGDIRAVFSLWVDSVARTLDAVLGRFKSRPLVQFVQDDDGSFTLRPPENMQKFAHLPAHRIRVAEGIVSEPLPPQWTAALSGGRAELVLQPSCFLFRPLELPKRASEFLEGIIRSQIDRLTPWNAGDAVYGWTHPTETTSERIGVTIAATARTGVAPLVQAIVDLGASSVEVVTRAPGDATPVRVMERRGGGADELGRIRVALRSVFAATGLVAALSVAASSFVAAYYDDQFQQVQHRIAERRAAIRAGQSGNAATALLEKRKQTTPASVMVIEELSALLPDHTYATELRIDGDKLQIAGVTHDAPSLIEIMERSPHFARATFFAPTTRTATDPGERFHIEAKIRPHFGLGS